MARPYVKVMKQVVKLAIEHGWTVDMTKRGHYAFRSPDKKQPVIHLSGTPSDHMTLMCSLAQLRRHGLPVPKK